MSRTREPSVTYFDPNGDTRLLLKQANGSPDKKTFVVSYKTMCLVCDSWDRILNPTGYSRETRHGHTISLPHDDWKALEIILNIAHLQFDLVPRKIDFHLLLEVAVLTEKYGATKIVRPWYRKWMKHNRKLGAEPGHEEWLWITWAFGEDQKFEKLTMKLVLELEKLPDGRFARTSEVVLDPNDPERHFPPGILGISGLHLGFSLSNLLKVHQRASLRLGNGSSTTFCEKLTTNCASIPMQYQRVRRFAREVGISLKHVTLWSMGRCFLSCTELECSRAILPL